MRHLSLFSGIGGFDLAAERAGFTTVLCAESDAHCRAILHHHWPDVPILEDVRSVDGSIKADIITGGFPCQDVSVAGNRAGLAGERSGLWREFARIIAGVRPAWVVIENVPGLLSSNGGRDMGAILGALGELGYWWAYRVLDAQYDNLAQRRERVFIVGHTRSRRAAEVLLEPEGLCWNPPPSRETGQAVTALTANGVGTCGADDNQAQAGHLIAQVSHALTAQRGQRLDPTGQDFVVSPLTCRPYADAVAQESGLVVASALTSSAGHHGHSSPRGDGADNLVVAGFSGGQGSRARSIGYAVEQSPTLRAAESGSNRAPCVLAFQPQAGGATALSIGENAPTLTDSQIAACTDGYSVRRLTPTECERLQGFPDGWTEGHSDSQRYKMLGNAVAVPVAEWILGRIESREPTQEGRE